MVRKIFVPERDEFTGGWRKICQRQPNQEIHKFDHLPNISGCSNELGVVEISK